MWDLSSLPRIEPAPSALEGLSLNYWIIRGVPTPTLDASYKSASDCSMPGCISFTISQSLLKLMCIEWVMPSNHLILCYPFSCPQSFPASGFFSVSWPFASGGQSTGASVLASDLPTNIQGWFPLRLTGLISLQSKGVSRVLSKTTVQKHQFFGAQPSLGSSYHICTWLLEKP